MAVKLSSKELHKPFHNGEHDDKFETRGEYLLNLISNGSEIELADGSKITLDPERSSEAIEYLKNKEYNKFTGRNKIIFSDEGKEYSITSFKKTEDFGSGKGQGGGSANTDLVESSQCLVNALCYKLGRRLVDEDLNPESLQSAQSDVNTTASLDDMINFITTNSSWKTSFMETANIFYSTYENGDFVFHRGSDFVSSIYNAFKKAANDENIKLHNDKWNPADIWAVSRSFEGANLDLNLQDLNILIGELNINEKLIGISLKKTKNDVKLERVNDGNKEDVELEVEEIVSSNKSTNSTLVLSDKTKITFRTFNFATNFAGEIQGKNAAHGKIGFGPLNSILRRNGETEMPNYKQIIEAYNLEDKDFLTNFHQKYIKYSENIQYENFKKLISSKGINFIVSKFLSLFICDTILNSQKQNELLSYIFNYAKSETSDSSMFIKIYEEYKLKNRFKRLL